jgi:hypothetical protein
MLEFGFKEHGHIWSVELDLWFSQVERLLLTRLNKLAKFFAIVIFNTIRAFSTVYSKYGARFRITNGNKNWEMAAVIFNLFYHIYLLLYPFQIVHVFWTAWGCVDGFSFHVLLRSGTKFRHHLLVVLWLHNLLSTTCIWRISVRCCQNFVSDQNIRGGASPWCTLFWKKMLNFYHLPNWNTKLN